MNPEQLLSHFNRISDAPDAIPRLRRFILDLAVRGKLVDQDPNDEPASDLLKRVQTEKEKQAKSGGLRIGKPLPSLAEDELPFQLPAKWLWSRLAEVGFLNPRNIAADELPASFVPMPLISAKYGVPNKHEVRTWGEIKKGYTHFADGDVALAKITPCFENGKSTVFRNLTGGIGSGTTELHVVHPVIVCADYILIFLKCTHFLKVGVPIMTGTAGQKRVPTEYFAHSPFPLPPLAEQRRIIAKVDELMALCDRLETAQAERESRRDRLVASSLQRLNQPADAPSLREHARFHLRHLPRLTTRPEHIQQLRQTILNLAVRGKLVPQIPCDEAPSELLHLVTRNKDGLVAKGNLRQIDSVPAVKKMKPFECPKNWIWTFPDQLSRPTSNALTIGPFGSNLLASDYRSSGTPLVFVSDIRSEFSAAPKHYISPSKAEELRGHSTGPGDLLITKMGDPPGDTAIYPADRPRAIITADCIKWTLEETLVLVQYLYYTLRAPLIASQIMEITKGAAHQKVSLKRFRGIYLPLPPLPEQYRIVAKVDELMALCDRLDTQLTTSQTESHRLLEAVLHEALIPTR